MTGKNVGRGLVGAVAAAALAAGALAGPAAAQEEPVKIGVILPLSGPLAVGGQNVRNGYEFGEKEINAAGGIEALGGAPVEFVFADNQGKQDVAIGEAERLITQEGVSALMGSWHSASTIAGTQSAERYKTPWLVEIASADVILERGFDFVSRVNVKASWYGEAPVEFLDYLNENGQEIKRVAIMYTDDDWGRASVGKGTKNALEAHGYEIVEDIAYPSTAQDMTTYINRVRLADPDAFIITSFPNDALLVGRAVQQLGLKLPVAVGVSAGYALPTFRSTLGEAADRWFVVGNWNPDIPGADALAAKFGDSIGAELNEGSALAYQTSLVMKEAIEKAGSRDREAINAALRSLEIGPGELLVVPFERIAFDETGQNPHASSMILQVQDGKLVTVWPEQYASSEPEIPFR